ncbi:SDR family NAD(P)-dependent oxidoreductase [Kordiimonas laminariae]|uniref:SDR family NAD(P)-dependent oxidoreductase n=1 Tax=Kordiimonas laminariae TaxID=2917717 RepID=UPI001FF43083|nr:SDR family oxidoreductase [Kordiimonas laminariae]MCK0070483.1 SDR family oxidoreductase [Kordiimonas laminariae]
MDLKGKIALITGGSRGIGKAIVTEYVKEGAEVYFTYSSNDAAAKETCSEIGLGEGRAFKADVRDREALKNVFNTIEAAHGQLDVLVNNAGINNPTDFDQITDEDWDEILGVNLKGPFVVTQEALGLLRKSGNASVVHIGSVSGQYGGPRTAHYAASKAGLISLGQVIARFLADDGIRSNTLAAGLVASEMAENAMNSPAVKAAAEQVVMKRFATTEEVAKTAVFLGSDKSSYITAQTINVNGGLYF